MSSRRAPDKLERGNRAAPKSRTPAATGKRAASGSRWRLVAVAVLLGLAWLGLWGRAGWVMLGQGPQLAERARHQHLVHENERGDRGDILDRNGRPLARAVRFHSVYARGPEVADPAGAARALAPVLDEPATKLRSRMASSSGFVWLARQVGDKAAAKVGELALPGIHLVYERGRLYPNNHLAGQVLGFVGVDGKGLEGVERALNDTLAPREAEVVVQRDAAGNRLGDAVEEGALDGEDVRLTIDAQVQDLAESALARAVRLHNARWGVCLVVEVDSGEILALANHPFFNPNIFRGGSPEGWRNRAALDVFEPGSTLKPFLLAAALQEGKVDTSETIFCEEGKWRLHSETIRDTHEYADLSPEEVLRYSSNIGAAKIGLELGAMKYHHYLERLGFGRPTGVRLPGESRGLVRPPVSWNEIDMAAISFGQGLGVTALQLARGYLALAADGVARPLKLVKGEHGVSGRGERVFSPEVASTVREWMIGVVEEDGTGQRARIEGMRVGGKTGTAQKASAEGGYGAGRVASFAGFFPGDDPEYLVLSVVDEPHPATYGGVVAAPVVREVAVGTLAGFRRLPSGAVAASGPDDPSAGVAVEHAKAARRPVAADGPDVPDLRGLPLRRAVEILASRGIVPVLSGRGTAVEGQQPAPGADWPEGGQPFTLRLAGYAES